MKKGIQILLIVAIIFLSYRVYVSIMTPIEFQEKYNVRYNAVVESLKNIRKAQTAYRDVNGKFTGSWDSLITFVKVGKIPMVKKIGALNDQQLESGMTEAEAIKLGIIIRDTIRVPVLDSLFGKKFDPSSINIIPFSNGQKFTLGTNTIVTGSGVRVRVFESAAHNNQFLVELKDEYGQEIININEKKRIDGKYPGLKVGSLTETNNSAGNWE